MPLTFIIQKSQFSVPQSSWLGSNRHPPSPLGMVSLVRGALLPWFMETTSQGTLETLPVVVCGLPTNFTMWSLAAIDYLAETTITL